MNSIIATPDNGYILPGISSPQVHYGSNSFEMSNQIDQIATALSSAQSELESAKKDNSGFNYKYSDLATVIETSKPVLAKHGLAITQLVGQVTTNTVSLVTLLTHKSGQYFKSSASIPLVEMKGCNVAQSAGASLSYLRRYSYQAIIGMASEDNDASSEGFKKESSAKADTKVEEPVRRRFTRLQSTAVPVQNGIASEDF